MYNESAARRVVSMNCLDSGSNVVMNVLQSNATIFTRSFYVGDAIACGFDIGVGLLTSTATVGIGSAKMSVYFEQGSEDLSTASALMIANTSWNSVATLLTAHTTTGSWTSGPVSITALPYGRFKVVAITPTTAATIRINFHKQV